MRIGLLVRAIVLLAILFVLADVFVLGTVLIDEPVVGRFGAMGSAPALWGGCRRG